MDRSKARTIARDTLRILDDGHYVAPSGARVAVRAHVDAAVAGTRDTRPDDPLAIAAGARTTRLEVTPESTMEAGERLAREGTRPALLNFASAHKPGGGFLGGAIAQEECLARSSGLYPCLRASAMYAHHAPLRGGTYTHWVVHSPAVPFFRDDRGALLEEPWRADVVTSAAVNAGVVLEREPERAGEVERLMRERTARVLGVFAARRRSCWAPGAAASSATTRPWSRASSTRRWPVPSRACSRGWSSPSSTSVPARPCGARSRRASPAARPEVGAASDQRV